MEGSEVHPMNCSDMHSASQVSGTEEFNDFDEERQ